MGLLERPFSADGHLCVRLGRGTRSEGGSCRKSAKVAANQIDQLLMREIACRRDHDVGSGVGAVVEVAHHLWRKALHGVLGAKDRPPQRVTLPEA